MAPLIFKAPPPPPPPSLSYRLKVEGCSKYLKCGDITITVEDNPPDLIEVHIVKRRKLHVVTDAQLRFQQAQSSMEEPTDKAFNGRLVFA